MSAVQAPVPEEASATEPSQPGVAAAQNAPDNAQAPPPPEPVSSPPETTQADLDVLAVARSLLTPLSKSDLRTTLPGKRADAARVKLGSAVVSLNKLLYLDGSKLPDHFPEVLRKSALPKPPKPRPARPANVSVPRTDSGNAERFAAQHGHKAKFIPQWNMWIVYDGKRWRKDAAAVMVGGLAKETVRSIYKEASSIEDAADRQDMVDWAIESEGKRPREAMVFLARSEPNIAIDFTVLDKDGALLNLDNGTLDLRTGVLRKHSPADLITKISPVKFDPHAKCDRFELFLSEIMAGDLGSVEFLRRFLGYCLSGSIREHTMCFWHGETGGNGKSTLTGIMFHILGDYGIKAAPDLLFRSAQSDRHPTELADLHGARLVVCNETAKDRTWDESTVKDITGGDPIKARRMREDFWSFNPSHKVVVFGNNKPTIGDTQDGGLRRRLRLVPFEVTFVGAPDKKLDATLRKEASGILSYLLKGCMAWQGLVEGLPPGLTDPPVIQEATADYFAEQDTIGSFVTERCDLNPLAKMPRKDLRVAMESWADEVGEENPSPKDVAKWLLKHNVTSSNVRDMSGKSVNGWKGIRLKPVAATADRTENRSGSVHYHPPTPPDPVPYDAKDHESFDFSDADSGP